MTTTKIDFRSSKRISIVKAIETAAPTKNKIKNFVFLLNLMIQEESETETKDQ